MSLAEFDWNAEQGIATLTLNRPDVLNAIDVKLAQALRDVTRTLPDRRGLRCVLLRGAGRAFVAGGDLAAFAADDFAHTAELAGDILDAMHEVLETFARIDAPVLGMVQGVAAGAGLSLVAACDLVIAAQGTRFITAYDRIGSSPDCGATYFLTRILGARRTAQLYLTGETLEADEALRLGLINRVVPAEQLAEEGLKQAQKLAAGPTAAFGRFKRLTAASLDRELPAQLAAERAAFLEGTSTADFREGLTAFLQKRPARFTGA